MFKRITIIGLGLIGGSLGLAIKEKHLAKEVIGTSRRKSTIKKALSLRVVDSATSSLEEAVKDSDLIILCTPVLNIIELTKKIAPFLKKGAILTDAGSTKVRIVKDIEKLLPKGVYFIGSHPIAGSERSGVRYSDKDLFKGAYCVITRSVKTNKAAFNRVKRFWKGLGMRLEVMAPEKHDEIISRISHLPHAISAALVNSCSGARLYLAAGGFKDTTRIASGSPELWNDIFITNKGNLVKDIAKFKRELSKLESALKKADERKLLKLLKKAKSMRDSIES
ncbi:MAG: prephenate dehydrogenase [Candidatus Omnitrophota bacterium]